MPDSRASLTQSRAVRAARRTADRLARSRAVRVITALVLAAAVVFGVANALVAEREAETTAPVVADLCRSGEAARAEAIQPGVCDTAQRVAERGAGTPGVVGPAGQTGGEGEDGQDGTTGPAGDAGPPGVPGVPGADGLPGTDGAPGPRGLTGTDGAPGAAGQVGTQGPPGPIGPAGPVGPAGAQGTPGETGPPGAPGVPPETQTFTDPDGQVFTCTLAGGSDMAPTYSCVAG